MSVGEEFIHRKKGLLLSFASFKCILIRLRGTVVVDFLRQVNVKAVANDSVVGEHILKTLLQKITISLDKFYDLKVILNYNIYSIDLS